jgi:hypothetical protein
LPENCTSAHRPAQTSATIARRCCPVDGSASPRVPAGGTQANPPTMSRSGWPYILTQEDAARLVAVLARRGGRLTLRDLYRRHRFVPYMVEAAAGAGLVRIETRKPRTGRPSQEVTLGAESVNKSAPAKLPRRGDIPRALTIREERFLQRYVCRRGTSFFGGPRGSGSAADAYRQTYGSHLSPGSCRSAGARLRRRPWMRAAFLLDRRLMAHGGRTHFPEDMRSAGEEWLAVIAVLDQGGRGWPPDAARAMREARTCPAACSALVRLGWGRQGGRKTAPDARPGR